MKKSELELIKKLRERTGGIGIKNCQLALVNNNFDIEKAIIWLRKEGIIKSAQKANRIAANGVTDIAIKNNKCVILEINCETDFVSENNKFHDLVNKIKSIIINDETIINFEIAKEKINYLLNDAIMQFGEKIDLRRLEIFNKKDNECFGKYNHFNKKISVLIVINKKNELLANHLAAHIASNNPQYITFESIPTKTLENEKEIALKEIKNNPKFNNKPDTIINKILEGKIKKNLDSIILHEQDYLYDNTKKIKQILLENDVNVIKMIRYQVSEGIVNNETSKNIN